MDYKEALEYVRKTKQPAYTFIPEKRLVKGRLKIVGGRIYCIVWNDNIFQEEEEEDEIYVHCVSGLFGQDCFDFKIDFLGNDLSIDSYEECYSLDDLNLGEIKNLYFFNVKGEFDAGYMIEYCLFAIEKEDDWILTTFDNRYQLIKYINSQSLIKKFDIYKLRVPFAIDDKGQIYSPARADRFKEFFCPACKQKVFLRHGDINIPHFSHKGKDICSPDAITNETAKMLIQESVKEWKDGYGYNPAISRACQICGGYSNKLLPGNMVEKAVLNYEINDNLTADVALLVGNKPQAFIQIKRYGEDFKKDEKEYLLPYIVVEGEDVLKNPLIWKPVVDGFNHFFCSNLCPACEQRSIIYDKAKRFILETIQKWKDDDKCNLKLLRSCQVCGEYSEKPLPKNRVEKVVLNYEINDNLTADVALLVGNKPQAFIQIKRYGEDFKKDEKEYLLPYIVVEGEEVLNNPLIWKPLVDRFNQFTCPKCKENWNEYNDKVKKLAESLEIEIPTQYYRYGISRCENCLKDLIFFAWPGMQENKFLKPLIKPIPSTVKSRREIEYRASGIVKYVYWSNACPYCMAYQKNNYLFRNPKGPFYGMNFTDNSSEAYRNDMDKIKNHYFKNNR